MKAAPRLCRFATAALLVVAVTASGNPGWVLCLGDDGHIAVEPAHRGECGSPPEAHEKHPNAHPDEQLRFVATALPSAAGGCMDLAFSAVAGSRLLRDLRHERFSADGFAKAPCADPVGWAASGCADPVMESRLKAEAPPGRSASLLAQRTIVLRI